MNIHLIRSTSNSGSASPAVQKRNLTTVSTDDIGIDNNEDNYSDHSTPPYLLWATNLDVVLDDPDGLDLFKQYLQSEGDGSHVYKLDFWYFCQGYKLKCAEEHSSEEAKLAADEYLLKLTKLFCQEYIDSRKLGLTDAVRKEVQRRVRENRVVQSDIFSEVQDELYVQLRDLHGLFVQSETYINYLQMQEDDGEGLNAGAAEEYSGKVESSAASETNLSVGEVHRPPSSLLPVVLEETEVDWASTTSTSKAAPGTSSELETCHVVPHSHKPCNGDSKASKSEEQCCPKDALHHSQSGIIFDGRRPGPSALQSHAGLLDQHVDPRLCGASSCSYSTATLPAANGGRNKRSIAPSLQLINSATPKLTQNSLKKTYQNRILNNIASRTQPGEPPNPYHTARPYKAYLPTSTQDSELQSMSSGANTESSVSGSNFRQVNRNAMMVAARNTESKMTIPRTKRPQGRPSTGEDMNNESFRVELCRKLQRLKMHKEYEEKIHLVLDAPNPRKAIIQECFATIPRPSSNRNDTDILDDHMGRLGPSWEPTPKQSPMRSPGLVPRRGRSPPATADKMPNVINRMMTTSYPSSGPSSFLPAPPKHLQQSHLPQALPLQQVYMNASSSFPHAPHEPSTSNSFYATHQQQPPQGSVAGIFVTRPPLLTSFESEMGHRPSSASNGQENPRNYTPSSKYASDVTSGFCSSNPSSVSQQNNPRGREKIVHGMQTFGTMGSCKSHAPSTNKSIVRDEVTQVGGLSSTCAPQHQGQTPAVQKIRQDFISIIYFLPNEATPFRSKFTAPNMRLKDFKKMVAKKYSSAKYFFKYEAGEHGDVWEEVTDDDDVLPFYKPNEVTGRVENDFQTDTQ